MVQIYFSSALKRTGPWPCFLACSPPHSFWERRCSEADQLLCEMRRVSRPFPISVKVVYWPPFWLPPPRCTLEKAQKQIFPNKYFPRWNRGSEKTIKNTSKVWDAPGRKQACCRETAGGQSRWMARVEERLNSLASPRPDLEWVSVAFDYRNL